MMKALCMRLFHLGLPAHRPRRLVHRRRHLRRHCPSGPSSSLPARASDVQV
ncbi:unnamed protein product, partial [Musa banksii]